MPEGAGGGEATLGPEPTGDPTKVPNIKDLAEGGPALFVGLLSLTADDRWPRRRLVAATVDVRQLVSESDGLNQPVAPLDERLEWRLQFLRHQRHPVAPRTYPN